eukprot:767566-Hanusia_phi.AAC.12
MKCRSAGPGPIGLIGSASRASPDRRTRPGPVTEYHAACQCAAACQSGTVIAESFVVDAGRSESEVDVMEAAAAEDSD